MSWTDRLEQRWLLPGLVIAAVIIAVLLVRLSGGPEHGASAMPPRVVETIRVEAMPFRARAQGYGNVTPATFLAANAEVAGRIVELHSSLERGATLAAGTVAVRIDPTRFELAVAQAEADLAASQANQTEMDVERANLELSLDIARSALTIGESELQRLEKLLDQGSVARSTVDGQRQAVLASRQDVQQLEGQLALLPSRRAVIEAQVRRAEAALADSERSLNSAVITLPFDARIGEVHVERDQYVSVSSLLFEASSMDRVEIAIDLPISQVRPLVAGLDLQARPFDPSIIDAVKTLGLEALVRLPGGPDAAQWKAEVVRVGDRLDLGSQTISFILAIDDPYAQMIPGHRPPLVRGMYVEATLSAPPRPAIVVPRSALHQGRVWLVDAGQLRRTPVEVASYQGDVAIIRSGLEEGDELIVSDVAPALDGLPVDPRPVPFSAMNPADGVGQSAEVVNEI